MGLVRASLPHTLGHACTFYAPTSPPQCAFPQPKPWAFCDPSNSERNSSRRVQPRQGTEICNFGSPSPLFFLNYFQLIFPFSPGFLCNFVRTSPEIWRALPDFRAEKESLTSCHASGWFFGPEFSCVAELYPKRPWESHGLLGFSDLGIPFSEPSEACVVIRSLTKVGSSLGSVPGSPESEQKISPKRKFSAGCPRGHPAKNFGQALQIPERTSILAQTCCTDVHGKTSGLSFVPYRRGSTRFVPISPFSSDLFQFVFLVFGNLSRFSGGPKGGHLKGGHLKMRFRSEVRT